jgi:hypothetical protein
MMTSPHYAERPGERGYSLAEVLVATAIFTIIFIAALMIYDRSNRVFKDTVEAGDLQQQVRVSFDSLVAEVRMAGFDFDRDGIPSGAQRYQQPDEQIEFAGASALTIRGNLDAELDAANDNGREADYEPPGGQFPVVTTANDEIVTYALKSISGPNADSIKFYADTRKPRRTYPGGADEQLVTITGVDLCTGGCMNPPYTLYRIALKDADLTNPSAPADFVWTPIADNIRSLRFQYFQDHLAKVAIAPNGGAGQYLVTSATTAASLEARTVRENINGMNAQPAVSYVSPVEAALPAAQQVASARRFRQYRLESLIVPRNIGLRGMQEFDTNPPGAPKVLSACSAGCGVVKVTWEAPAVGMVDSYAVLYDTNPSGTFSSSPLDFGQALEGHIQGLDPTQIYYFVVVAQNSHGTQRSINISPGVQPVNPTKAEEPVAIAASGESADNPVQENKIEVRFTAPEINVAPYAAACGNNEQIPQPVKGEITAYRVYRSEDPANVGTQIWPPPVSPSPLVAPEVDNAGNGTFNDVSELVTCTPYYYRFVAVEAACAVSDALNTGAPVPAGGLKMLAESDMSGASPPGKATTNAKPEKAALVSFVGSSSCGTDPCHVEVEWPQVTKDVDGKAIFVKEYLVRRVSATSAGPIPGTEATFTVQDADLADGIAAYTDEPPQPASDTFYAYSVAARQLGGADCSTQLTGEYSTPRNFPCIQMTISPPTFGLLDGEGTIDNPWLVSAPLGSITVTATLPITTAYGILYDMAGNPISKIETVPVGNQAVLEMPLATNDGVTYRFDITVVDSTGCSNTETRYLTDAVTACCLAPYKLEGGTTVFDKSIVTQVDASTIDVRLRNLCDDGLELKSIRVAWPTGTNISLSSIAFPPLTGTTPIVVTSGATVSPTTITVPTGARTTVGGGTSDYVVRIRFSKSGVTADTATFGVRARYDRPANFETGSSCQIVQTPTSPTIAP